MEETEPPPSSKPPLSRAVPRDKPSRTDKTAPGSLDRRRHHQNRVERDQKSRSSHVLKSPPRLEDFTTCQNWCCSPHDYGFDHFPRRHERLDPQRYGSNPILEQHQRFIDRGSHSDIYSDCGRYRHEYQCCSYHMYPPPCCFNGDRSYHYFQPPCLKVSTLLYFTY